MEERRSTFTALRRWYNYATGEYDLLDSPATDEEALRYIPQHPACVGLFRARRAQDDAIPEAMIAVLQACVGVLGERPQGGG